MKKIVLFACLLVIVFFSMAQADSLSLINSYLKYKDAMSVSVPLEEVRHKYYSHRWNTSFNEDLDSIVASKSVSDEYLDVLMRKKLSRAYLEKLLGIDVDYENHCMVLHGIKNNKKLNIIIQYSKENNRYLMDKVVVDSYLKYQNALSSLCSLLQD